MLATEQQIVEGEKTVACCDMLATGQHICDEGRKKNDREQVSNSGSLASGQIVQGDSISYAYEPNVENQNTEKNIDKS